MFAIICVKFSSPYIQFLKQQKYIFCIGEILRRDDACVARHVEREVSFLSQFFFVMKVSQRQLEVMDSLPSCLSPQTGMPW